MPIHPIPPINKSLLNAIEYANPGVDNWCDRKWASGLGESIRHDLPDLQLVAAIADSGSLTRAAALFDHLAEKGGVQTPRAGA